MNQTATLRPLDTDRQDRIAVVHLIHTVAYGGVETALINWLRKLDRARFSVHLVCFANPGATEAPFVDAARRHGLEVATIPWGRHKPVFTAARRLAALLRGTQAQILHTHNCYADVVGAVVRKHYPVKTITTLYVWADLGWKRNLIQRVNEFAIRRLDKVTAHCDETRKRTLQRGFSADEVNTLICGFETRRVELSTAERTARRRALGATDDDIVLANIARFYPEKAQDALLRIYRAIAQRYPATRLWIAGVGPLEQKLRQLCHELGLDDRVTFLGFVRDLPELMALVDIQVHPALTEGVPLAICEGMAAGLPIIASAVGGLPEVLHDDLTGVLVPEGNEAAFVQALAGLIDDSARRRRLGDSARRFIENDYSLERAVTDLEHTYLKLIGT